MSTASNSNIKPLPSLSLLDWFTCESSPTILLLDGGVSTYLEQLLAKRNQVFSRRELWSSSLLLDGLDEDVVDCHNAFAAAGADILSTITYQCHFGVASGSFQQNKIVVDDDTMTGMMRHGIVLARQCTNAYVAASLGSYGAALADGSEYRGEYKKDMTRQTLREFHRRRIQAILPEHPDAIAFETVPNADEVSVLAQLVRESSLSSVAVWISLGCRNDHQLNDGTEIETVLDDLCTMDPTGDFIHAVGFNCCDGRYVSNLLRILTLHMATHGPKRGIVVYPNSGEEWDATHATWKDNDDETAGGTSPSQFADELHHAIQVVEQTWEQNNTSGTQSPMPRMIIGGCCRTSPDTILALRGMIDQREADKRGTA